MLPLKTTVMWFLIYARGLLDTVLFSVLYLWLGLLVVECKQGLANSLLDGANFARWSACERDDSHCLISSLLRNLLFFPTVRFSSTFFSVIFFPFSKDACLYHYFTLKQAREFSNATWQGVKSPFSQEEQEKGNNGLRNWKTNTSYVDYNWFI